MISGIACHVGVIFLRPLVKHSAVAGHVAVLCISAVAGHIAVLCISVFVYNKWLYIFKFDRFDCT